MTHGRDRFVTSHRLTYQDPRVTRADLPSLRVNAIANVLQLDVTGIDILFDEDGYRVCEANSAPGFRGGARRRAR